MDRKNLVLLSKAIFDGKSDAPFSGYVRVRDGLILEVKNTSETPQTFADEVLVDVGDKLIMPGAIDDHTFFSGWALNQMGTDLAGAETVDELLAKLAHAYKENTFAHEMHAIYGHNLPKHFEAKAVEASLTKAFPGIAVTILYPAREGFVANEEAYARYELQEGDLSSENFVHLIREYLGNPELKELYLAYQSFLNSRGIVGLKEMCFDDYAGFWGVLKEHEHNEALSAYVSLQSQPVAKGADFAFAKQMHKTLTGPCVGFSGFNRMSDRSIASGMAELKEPYAAYDTHCLEPVDWALIESEVKEADSLGFRFSLHAQGDAAVAHAVDLFDSCKKNEHGKLLLRHAITDLELSDADDLKRFGAMGGICEIYPQIQQLDTKADLIEMVNKQIGPTRYKRYWQRRQMQDAGCVLSCGTDLPLLLPHLGESIASCVYGHFKDGEKDREENMLTLTELLKAWTYGGAYGAYLEEVTGSLDEGKHADICVLARNPYSCPPKEATYIGVDLTLFRGSVVYSSKRLEI